MQPATPTSLLAVYGTLRRGYRNYPLIERGSTHLGVGHLRGRLIHIASPVRRYPYPGYVPDGSAAATRAVVEVVDIADESLWPSLDALERYVPGDPAGSEYLRLPATAHMVDGRALTCWTYVYNADITRYDDVPDGDWACLYSPDVTGP
ncbi:MAG: gamma-glutamylcyclotransferase family protein [Jiangellales bacterium]